ncbi:TrmB family transcriptional regulator [Natronoarchaeum mannanilyticum]|uniref:Helix-turn-helix domain-containing protein n=1 Tax=Natronoarchaeum mannanilyticum TaxID=926360 RepID=A0AAV3TAE5_9EURY
MPTESEAVELLEELGLTEYEARCFVALSRVEKASAKEVSDLSEVPRSRVYDAVERLHRRGLVDVQQSDPREFRALSQEKALQVLRDQHEETLANVGTALGNLERSDDLEESGAWAISDHEHVTDRIETLLGDADDEAYLLVTDESAMERDVRSTLAGASDRGVDVITEVPSDDAEERLLEDVPDATVRITELAGDAAQIESKWLSRIVMVDRRSVLLGALTDDARPGRTIETAIWAKGSNHGLVVGVRHLLTARIEEQGVFD